MSLIIEKPPAGRPGVDASAGKAVPEGYSAATAGMPAFALAVLVIAARYGLPLPWAQVVAAAAGLGERLA